MTTGARHHVNEAAYSIALELHYNIKNHVLLATGTARWSIARQDACLTLNSKTGSWKLFNLFDPTSRYISIFVT